MENKTFQVTDDILATQGDRFINYIVDFIVQFIVMFGVGIVAVFISDLFGNSEVLFWLDNINRFQEYVYGLLITIVYYGLSETYFSRTIGKLFTKTIVVMEDGSKPDTITILKRTFSRIIPFNILSFAGSNRGWHDTIPNVYVVKIQAMKESRELFYAFDEIGNSEA